MDVAGFVPTELRFTRYMWGKKSSLRTIADYQRSAERRPLSDHILTEGDSIPLEDCLEDRGIDWTPVTDRVAKQAEIFLERHKDKDYLTLRQREQCRVAGLLLNGLTQEKIAKRIGLSRHKVRDRISEIARRSDANSVT